MYNRYIRNDQGSYTRIPEEDAPPTAPPPPPAGPSAGSPGGPGSGDGPPTGPPPPPPPGGLFGGFSPGGDGSLRKLLDRFHLDRIDSGDLLLLGLLFLLYREGADEELLIALGLLLIL